MNIVGQLYKALDNKEHELLLRLWIIMCHYKINSIKISTLLDKNFQEITDMIYDNSFEYDTYCRLFSNKIMWAMIRNEEDGYAAGQGRDGGRKGGMS